MIIITGNSGSGKTTVAKSLETLNCNIIPTYSTRNPRPNDDYTVCISEDEFKVMINDNKFMAHSSFDSKLGKLYYGIPNVKQNNKINVVIAVYEYIEDIIKYAKSINEPILKVFIDVDDETIINTSMKDSGRGESNKDIKNRLERDRKKNLELKVDADVCINNHGMKLEPMRIASIILTTYDFNNFN